MASLARMVGKAASAMAPLAQASAMATLRNEFQKERDATLQQYGVENREDTQAHQTNERVAGEDFTRQENEQNRALDSRRLDISEEQLALNKTQAEKIAKQIDQDLQIGQFALDEAQQLKDIRDQIIATDDAELQQTLYEKYLNIQGKEPDNKFSFIKISDEFGGDSVGRGNTRTGTFEMLDSSGSPSGGGASIPSEAIDDLRNASDRESAVKEFDEVFGEGAAARVLGSSASAPTPSASGGAQSSPSTQTVNANPQPQPKEDKYSNLAMPGEGPGAARPQMPPLLANALKSTGDFLSQGPERFQQRVSGQQRDKDLEPALTLVYNAINQGELPAADTPTRKRLIQKAIDSGELDEELAQRLQQYLNDLSGEQSWQTDSVSMR